MLEEQVREVINNVVTLPETADREFSLGELGIDSLDAAEIVQGLEEEFADQKLFVADDAVSKWQTLGDICDYVSENMRD